MTVLDPIVAVAIALLGAIFIGSLIAFIFVLRHKYCKKKDLITEAETNNDPDQTLVDTMEEDGIQQNGEFDIEGINIVPPIDELLQDEDWVDDATGLIPHCLPILKTCHQLTEKLVAMTMGNAGQLRSPESLTEIVTIVKRISPRVDDVVRSMYPPLDPRLLEARCTALVLSVTHLVIVTKNACRLSGVMDWIDQSLADIEDHLAILREASVNVEHAIRLSMNSNGAAASANNIQVPSMSHDNTIANGHAADMSHDQPTISGQVLNTTSDQGFIRGYPSIRSHDQAMPNGHISFVDRDSIQLTEKIKSQIQLRDHLDFPKHFSTHASPSHCPSDNSPDIQQSTVKNQIQVPLTVHRPNETSQV